MEVLEELTKFKKAFAKDVAKRVEDANEDLVRFEFEDVDVQDRDGDVGGAVVGEVVDGE